MNEDFLDLLEALQQTGVEFLIIGAHALSVHGVTRATGDLDIVVATTAHNAERLVQALNLFGARLSEHGISAADFRRADMVYQMGLPPRRIDVLTSIDGCRFEDAWAARVHVEVAGRQLPFLGLADLIANKQATGRPKDLLDIELLREVGVRVED